VRSASAPRRSPLAGLSILCRHVPLATLRASRER
jgi:hypothetical protein